MTIAVALKVGDGVVLGADSASTLADPNSVINVYFNAEKVFNLVKGLPIGFVTYGLGGLAGEPMGFLVAGFAAQERHAEAWEISIDASGNSPAPRRIFGPADPDGAAWRGQPEALTRLMGGWSTAVAELLINHASVPEAEVIRVLNALPVTRLFHSAMPLQDAIDLVEYMIEVTIGFVRFSPGALTVHEPVDIAAISFHEGFRWVSRKHYYGLELNPG